MTKQQENRAFVKMLKEVPKKFGRVSFRERLMLREVFTYITEEVIGNIKANCDLAIEGRDVKIMELKDHLAEEVELHLHAEEYIKSLEKENKTIEGCLLAEQEYTQMLEQQIEKMKCCGNCNWNWSCTSKKGKACEEWDLWEIKENGN